MKALDVKQLTVSYHDTPVLWDISLEIPAGKLVAIVGPNGAGKSTFLKAILGLVEPISGKILILGEPLKNLKNRLAYVPQRDSVDWDFPITVKELVLMGRYGRLKWGERIRDADYAACEHVLKEVGMLDFKDRQINELSGGQKQRIFIARALIQEADVLFLDEPFAGIDLASEKLIMTLLRNLVNKGKSVFVVHHDLPSVETHFDWAILLNLRLTAYGPVHQVMNATTLADTYGKSFHLIEELVKAKKDKIDKS